MEPDGSVFVQRPKCQTLNPHYAQRIITHVRGSIMTWEAFAWLGVDPIAKINEKIFHYLYFAILKNKMQP